MEEDKSKAPAFIVVIGASAGGLNAVSELAGQLNSDMNIAVFVVLHLSSIGIGDFLVLKLQESTSLICKKAGDNEPFQRGHIYIAPPNHHLLVKKDKMLLGEGPHENRFRPSIDVLFRSAAVSWGPRVIGIVLTGLLDDGTAGMWAIKRCGGSVIVQDPNEAEYPDMPLNVLNNMEADYSVPLSEMGNIIGAIAASANGTDCEVPSDLRAEAEIAEMVATGIDKVKNLGEQTPYTCPDCGGTLWELHDHKIRRFRCYTGHSYSEQDLLLKQNQNIESTLWMALRMMEERRNLLNTLTEDTLRKGFKKMASAHKQKAEEMEAHIGRLKQMLFITKEDENAA